MKRGSCIILLWSNLNWHRCIHFQGLSSLHFVLFFFVLFCFVSELPIISFSLVKSHSSCFPFLTILLNSVPSPLFRRTVAHFLAFPFSSFGLSPIAFLYFSFFCFFFGFLFLHPPPHPPPFHFVTSHPFPSFFFLFLLNSATPILFGVLSPISFFFLFL